MVWSGSHISVINSSLSRWVSRTRLPPSRIRFQGRSGWGFYCKWSKIDWMSMNEENSRASIRAREAEKSHSIRTFLQARGAKKKGPNCIQIRVLLWCRKWDSALRVRSACAPRSACAAAALPGPYKSPTGAFAIRGFESLIAKQKPPPWGRFFVLVPEVGLEPTRGISPADFESATSANSIIPASCYQCAFRSLRLL